LWAQKETERD